LGCYLGEIRLLGFDEVRNDLFLLEVCELVKLGLLSENVLSSILKLRISFSSESLNFVFLILGSVIEVINSLISWDFFKEESTSNEHDNCEDDL